jgi:23S rRNA (cytidine2498-2'-O)-methyltransferase
LTPSALVGTARVGEGERVDIYLVNPASTDVLLAELATLRKGARPTDVATGAVGVPDGQLVDPCFARQVLPRAVELDGKNANDIAARALDHARSLHGDAPLGRVDVVMPELPRRGSKALDVHPLAPSAHLLEETLRAKIDGRAAKAKAGGAVPSTSPPVHLQVLLVDGWRAFASVDVITRAPALLAWPSPFPGGRALPEVAKDAPSSAHRKIDEALCWLGAAPTEQDLVLDLGAAPGGWSWSALSRGARVVAVDRAELSPGVAKHPKLVHVRKDAFTYVPDERPTWLLCDVIADPEKSLKVAEDALAHKELKALVVTLKLKNPISQTLLGHARALARGRPQFFGRAKSLAANKSEVTLLMRRRDLVDDAA